jgi:hypothetical protein
VPISRTNLFPGPSWHTSRAAALVALLAAGCANRPAPVIQSPARGSVLKQDWAPITVLVPAWWKKSHFDVSLDGQPADDPVALVRDRQLASKRGAQYIAYLDLSDLLAGKHELTVDIHGAWFHRGAHLETNFTVEPAPNRVAIHVVDGQGRPVSARVFVVGPEGALNMTDAASWKPDSKHREPTRNAVFAVGGAGEVRLPPGRYTILAARGFREDVGQAEILVPQDSDVRLTVPRLVDTPGVLAADLHVHTGLSDDAFTPHRARAASFAASGLDVVGLADHDRVSDPAVFTGQMAGLVGVPAVIGGMELDVRSHAKKEWDIAHLTAGPLLAGDTPPTRYSESVSRAIDSLRRLQRTHPHPVAGQDVLVELAHPRGIHFRPGERSQDRAWALFNNKGYNRTIPVGRGPNAWMTERDPRTGTSPLDVDAIEVANRMGLDKYREVRQDWFALLDQGIVRAGTGNSDSHALAVEMVGWPCNLVSGAVGLDGAPDPAALVRSVREGRVVVTTGPVVDLEARTGAVSASSGLFATGGVPVDVTVRVRAAPWVPVHELRLVENGVVVERIDLGGEPGQPGTPLVREFTFHRTPTRDAWILAEVGWPEARQDIDVGGIYGIVVPGYVPFAFTNPVRLDVDGDGAWTPPGLPLP